MDYGQVLTRAFSITWRHKYLWLLALFAGESSFSLTSFGNSGGRNRGGGTAGAAASWAHFTSWLSAHAALVWTAAVAAVVLFAVFFVISAIAEGAVIRGAAEHDLDRPSSLRSAWSSGLGTFWPVLQVKLVALGAAVVSVVLIGSLVALTVTGIVAGNVALAVSTGALAGMLLLAAIPFWVVFGTVVLLAARSVVLDGQRATAALGAGFRLIRRRFGRVALVWLLLTIIGPLAGLAAGFAALIAGLPLAAIVAAAYVTGGLSLAIAFGAVAAAIWLAVALALVAWVKAYTSAAWTLAYRRFDQEPQPVPSAQPLPGGTSPAPMGL